MTDVPRRMRLLDWRNLPFVLAVAIKSQEGLLLGPRDTAVVDSLILYFSHEVF